MAENKIENQVSFSIEDTMDMGIGNTELVKDLLAPESASESPDNLEPVVKEVEEKEPKPAKKAKVKEIPGDEEPEEEKEKAPNPLADFMKDNEDDEEEEGKEKKPIAKPVYKEETAEEENFSQFSALAKDLYKLGVFTSEEDDEETNISTPEEFLERFNAEKKKGATEMVQSFIGQFGEDYQNAFDAIFVKGADPKEYFSVYNSIVDYAQMDMSKEANQEMVVKQALTDQGLEPEDVTTEIDRLKNYGDLESVAAKHHKVLVKKEAAKLQHLEQKAEEEVKQKALVKNQYISNVQAILQEKIKTKEFDGIPINPKLATELQDFLLVDKWKTPSGETLTDFDRAILELKRPENHANKVKLALLLKIMEKDPTFSTIQKSGVTKKTNQLFSETVRQVTKPKTEESKPASWFSSK